MDFTLLLIQITVSLAGILILGFVILKGINSGEYVSCKNLFALFTIVDVFLPAFVGAFIGQYQRFPYYEITNQRMYAYASIVFFVSILLFGFGWKVKSKHFLAKDKTSNIDINEQMLFLFYFMSVAIIACNLYIEYRACGNLNVFYEYKITRAYLVKIEYSSAVERIIQLASEFSTSVMFVTTSIGFVNYNKLRKRAFWKMVAPLISFFITLTTLYRGTILTYVCMLLISMQFKNSDRGLSIKLSPKSKRIIKRLIVLGVLGFVVYGGIRTGLNSERWGNELSFKESIFQMFSNTFGTTLVALARCIQFISSETRFFAGESILEMFYSFVPRSIWTSKPTHYGIVSLTMAMGSPSTTMDAVSIPGELIMNFDFFGLILIPVIGYIFKEFDLLKFSSKYRYIYAAVVFSFVTTSMWMSFTGFFAKVKYFPVYFLVCHLVVRSRRKNNG